MKVLRKPLGYLTLVAVFAISVLSTSGAPVVRQGGGANPAAIQALVDQFRADLGGANNGAGGSFKSGRRELNWDGVPNSFAEPNNFPIDFFNVNSPRGAIFNAIEDDTGSALNQFAVSASAASGVAVRFANINANYSSIFQTFSAERLFIARNTQLLEVNFVIPGTNIPATVNGFGVIFTDVDSATGGNRSLIRLYGPDGRQLPGAASAPVADNGVSFVGVSYNAGERVSRVVIECGNVGLSASNNDGVSGVDVVAMDDMIYGEPRAESFHTGDFDGDGVTDLNIFRPSSGTWFNFNSGSNTIDIAGFGQNGDIPVDGDFDGDGLADRAIFRPSDGTWWLNRTTAGVIAMQFGVNGDKPVTGDYDKDGKTDVAIWRPSNGLYLILRSSTGFSTFFGTNFGQTGDIPIQGAAQ
ncbi:MAG TPA: VCBS repeat-containing protein [Pyrinomonadaceae bacterium]|nr:VCBS repeat-containing protein [Pyrinomonadaceae bacterium]